VPQPSEPHDWPISQKHELQLELSQLPSQLVLPQALPQLSSVQVLPWLGLHSSSSEMQSSVSVSQNVSTGHQQVTLVPQPVGRTSLACVSGTVLDGQVAVA
jgi:hypothetical protein